MSDGIFYAAPAQGDDNLANRTLDRGLTFAERPTGFVENFAASRRSQTLLANVSSRDANRREAYDPLVDMLNAERDPGVPPFRNPVRADAVSGWQIDRTTGTLVSGESEQARIWAEIARRRAADPQALQGVPDSAEAFDKAVLDAVAKELPTLDRIGSASTTVGALGSMAGGLAGAMEDPTNIAMLAFGAPAGISIGRAMVQEALLGVGIEVVSAPTVAGYYEDLGRDYTAADFLLNAASAAGGAAAFTGAVRGIPPAIRLVLDRRARGEPVPDGEAAAAATAANGLTDTEMVRVLKRLPPTEHLRAVVSRAEEALRRLKEGRRVQKAAVPATGPTASASGINPDAALAQADEALQGRGRAPAAQPLTAPASEDWRTLNGSVRAFDPNELQVDAQRFQFKSGGDDQGVTERLKGVRQWNAERANAGIVWLDEAGQAFIVDGHQRLALAKRILAQADGQQPKINAFVLRAVDGVTASEAMARAAMKNLAEGTGTAVDAAKVLRARPDLLDASVPRNSANVRHGQALAHLSNESFDLVVNRLVPEDHAAVIARLAPDDPALQLALMRLFAQEPLETIAEAEALARQFIDNRGPDQTIEDLFGAIAVADSAFRERARVLSRALAQLRQEKGLFATVARNQDTLTAAGNTLAAGNADRAGQAAVAAELLQRLANRRGPVADALNAAARQAKETGRYETPVKEFARVVRRAIADGDVARLTDGRAIGPDEPAGQVGQLAGVEEPARPGATGGAADPAAPDLIDTAAPSPAETAALDLFSEPAGRGQQAQLSSLEARLNDLPEDLEIPLLTRIGEDGEPVTETRTVADLLHERDMEQDFLDVLDICQTGTRG